MTTHHPFRSLLLLCVAQPALCFSLQAGEHPPHEGFQDSHDLLGADLAEGWFDPPRHTHVSPLGTPLIHSFRLEPAFTHRDLFLDYSFRSGPETTAHEVEAELEWALTRRLGVVVELPYSFLDPDGGPSADGFGDLAISPRFLVAEHERFLLACSLEVETPTGDEMRGLGGGEVALAPSLSSWVDLGNWWTLNSQVGVEHALESSETELLFRASLIHTFGAPERRPQSHPHHDHLPPGLLSLIIEIDGTVGLSGEEEGTVAAEGIIGAYLGLTESLDLRAGYQFPLSSPRDLDGGVTAGLVWHF